MALVTSKELHKKERPKGAFPFYGLLPAKGEAQNRKPSAMQVEPITYKKTHPKDSQAPRIPPIKKFELNGQ